MYQKVYRWYQQEQIDEVCQFPDQVQGHDAAHKDHQDIEDEIQLCAMAMKEIVVALAAKETPAHQCCQREADNGDSQDFIPEEGEFSKCSSSE